VVSAPSSGETTRMASGNSLNGFYGNHEAATRTTSATTVHLPTDHGQFVDVKMAQLARRTKNKVRTTQSYRSRLQPGMTDVSNSMTGVILAVHQVPDGHTADILWDHGKAFSGYCIGYRGLFDLELVDGAGSDPSSSVTYEKVHVADRLPRLKSDERPAHQSTERIDIDGGSGLLTVNVGYLGKAPKVNHSGGKHIWSTSGPMSYH